MNIRKGTIIILPVILIGLLVYFLRTPSNPQTIKLPAQPVAPLGETPTWKDLNRFDHSISKTSFLDLLTHIYCKDTSWEDWITISDNTAQIKTDFLGDNRGYANLDLRFSETDQAAPSSIWPWKRKPTPLPGRPLNGLHIALDPGHIGGEYAKMEERHHQYDDNLIIREGSMTLKTAKLLRPKLETLGAKVTLVRHEEKPVTTASPEDFEVKRLFYRTSEIRARAKHVNHEIQPDLVICLHFNASGSPIPIPGQHAHILINGCYHANELKHGDERLQMLQRLLSRTAEVEIPLAKAIAKQFEQKLQLPAYQYNPENPYAQKIRDTSYIWSRNLLANRLYQCPVVFLEPYVMNSTDFIARFKNAPQSIYQEYAEAVAAGIANHFKNP